MDNPKQILYKELHKLMIKVDYTKYAYDRAVKEYKELNAEIVSMEDNNELIEDEKEI